MQIKELREKSIADLYKELNGLKKEYTSLSLNIKAGKSTELNKKKSVKKDIARIKTLISEKKVIKSNEKI